MKELTSIIRRVACSPWTYLYWAVSAAGTTCAYFNTGLKGSPLLGAASIASTVIALALFYFHLNKLRNELDFPGRRSALGLFLSIYALRLQLLLIFSPLIGLILWQGTFGRLATEYLLVSTAPPERKFGELLGMLSQFWLLLATFAAYSFVDIAGRSQVVAKGFAKGALRALPSTMKKIALPLVGFALARFALAFIAEYFSFLDYIKLTDDITIALVSAIALEPISYGLQMVTVLFLAKRLVSQAPAA
jgi:hypothetical protein